MSLLVKMKLVSSIQYAEEGLTMSISRMLLKSMKKKYKGKILGPNSEKRFNAIMICPIICCYLIGVYVESNKIMFSDCQICQSISVYIPSIKIMASGSRYPEAMKYVWLTIILASPVVLILMFILVRDLKRRVLPLLSILLISSLCLSALYTLIFGISFGGVDAAGRTDQLYYKYLFFSTILACSISLLVPAGIFHLVHHLLGLPKERHIHGENHDR